MSALDSRKGRGGRKKTGVRPAETRKSAPKPLRFGKRAKKPVRWCQCGHTQVDHASSKFGCGRCECLRFVEAEDLRKPSGRVRCVCSHERRQHVWPSGTRVGMPCAACGCDDFAEHVGDSRRMRPKTESLEAQAEREAECAHLVVRRLTQPRGPIQWICDRCEATFLPGSDAFALMAEHTVGVVEDWHNDMDLLIDKFEEVTAAIGRLRRDYPLRGDAPDPASPSSKPRPWPTPDQTESPDTSEKEPA